MIHADHALGPKDVFLDSLARCDHDQRFIAKFYERFTASSPEVQAKFAFTDFTRQQRMLRRSLELIAKATAGDSEGLRELNDRAETHGRTALRIEPALYDLWLEALLATAAECDAAWTAHVEGAWREILGIAIHHMTKKYDE
ncbi:MAG: globin [Vicinamibacterales bacterium]